MPESLVNGEQMFVTDQHARGLGGTGIGAFGFRGVYVTSEYSTSRASTLRNARDHPGDISLQYGSGQPKATAYLQQPLPRSS